MHCSFKQLVCCIWTLNKKTLSVAIHRLNVDRSLRKWCHFGTLFKAGVPNSFTCILYLLYMTGDVTIMLFLRETPHLVYMLNCRRRKPMFLVFLTTISVLMRLCSDLLTTSLSPFLLGGSFMMHLVVQFNGDMLCLCSCQYVAEMVWYFLHR